MTRVLIADDHAVVRAGVSALLNGEPEFSVVGEAADGEEALRLVRQLEPDLLLLDLAMPRRTGLEVLRDLGSAQSQGPCPRVILLTAAIERRKMIQALRLGARGIVLKESGAEALFQAIRAVMSGQYWVGSGDPSDLVNLLHEEPAVHVEDGKPSWGLTPREHQILGSVAKGRTNKEVAERFSISEDTVKHHVSSLLDKLGVSNRSEMAVFALRNQLIAQD